MGLRVMLHAIPDARDSTDPPLLNNDVLGLDLDATMAWGPICCFRVHGRWKVADVNKASVSISSSSPALHTAPTSMEGVVVPFRRGAHSQSAKRKRRTPIRHAFLSVVVSTETRDIRV